MYFIIFQKIIALLQMCIVCTRACSREWIHVILCMHKSEDKFWKLFSFHHVEYRDWVQNASLTPGFFTH